MSRSVTGRLALLALLVLAATLSACSGDGDVPTLEVKRGPFARRVIAEGNLEAVTATPVTAPMESDGAMRIAWLVPDGSRVKTGDVVVRFDPTDMEKKLVDGQSDRAAADSRIEGTRAQSDGTSHNLELDAGIAQQELEYAGRFQSKDTEIFSRADIIQSEIDRDLASKKLEHAESVKGIRSQLGKVDLDLLAIERRKADIKISQAKKGLAALEVTAPHDGILVFKRDWRGSTSKVGDTVWTGQPLAEIPRMDSMQAKVFVLEADAGGLVPGLDATVQLEAHPERTYKGKIKKVDSLARRRIGWIPVQYFGVVLELERTDPDVMKPGARLQATLELDARPDAVSVPRSAVFDREGKKIVYRRKGSGFDPVEVTLGPTAVGRVVVEKGLTAGDIVALRDPTKPADTGAPGEKGGPQRPAGPGAGGVG